LLENVIRLPSGVLELPPEQIDRCQPNPYIEVIGSELLRLEEVRICLSHLSELIVNRTELFRRARVARVETKHVSILENGVAVLLAGGIFVAPLQVARLLRFRRPRTAGDDQPRAREQGTPPQDRARHRVVLPAQSGR